MRIDVVDKLPERFVSKIKFTSTCWIWKTGKFKDGYGQYWNAGKGISAHRFSWECVHGKIPNGLFVLHKCDNPSCVNPNHLFLGTLQDNSKDMVKKNRAASGEKNANSKLTWKIVNEIRQAYKPGTRFKRSRTSISGLAAKYGVGTSAVHSIVRNQTWVEKREKNGG